MKRFFAMFVFCLSASPLDSGTFARVAPAINGRTRWLFRAALRLCALLVFSLLALPLSGAPMRRVARVLDSRTIVVDGGTTVTLRGVDIPPADEAMAADYLRSLLGNAWVLVEDGDVYRSPDALYVNGQLITHAYRRDARMTYLGEAMPGPRAKSAAPAPRPAPSTRTAPPRRAHRRAPQRGFVPKKRGV